MIAALARKLALEELPSRFEAEEKMTAHLRQRKPLCVVALAIDYYPVLLEHFGYEGGDEALLAVARHLPAGRLYRWSGSAFVVVLETIDAARILLNCIPERYTVQVLNGDDRLDIPFSVRSRVFQPDDSGAEMNIARRIDHWVATPWRDASRESRAHEIDSPRTPV